MKTERSRYELFKIILSTTIKSIFIILNLYYFWVNEMYFIDFVILLTLPLALFIGDGFRKRFERKLTEHILKKYGRK